MASLPLHVPFSPASHLLPAWLRVPHTLPISGIGYGVILGSEPRPGEEQGRGPLGRRKGDLCLTHADVPEGLAAAHAGCHQARRPHVRTGLRHTGGDCWRLSYRIATPKGSGKSAPRVLAGHRVWESRYQLGAHLLSADRAEAWILKCWNLTLQSPESQQWSALPLCHMVC